VLRRANNLGILVTNYSFRVVVCDYNRAWSGWFTAAEAQGTNPKNVRQVRESDLI